MILSIQSLRQSFLLCTALGVLGACGSTEPSEQTSLDTRNGGQQARAGLETAQPVISPELAVNAQPYSADDSEPAVAAGAGVYFVAWVEYYARPRSIVGARVRASDGVLLDAQPIRLYNSPFEAKHPSVAFDGSNFLVVWEEASRSISHIYGMRVRASDGAKLDSDPLFLSTAKPPEGPPQGYSPPQHQPSVAFDGTNYLVVWRGGAYGQNGTVFPAVNGNRVRPSDGKLVDPYSFVIAATSSERGPRVAYANGHYLVVWHESQGAQGLNVVGTRIHAASNTVLDSPPRAITSAAGDEHLPVIASAGSQFLVVWNAAGGALRGTRVGATDAAVLDGAGFTVGGGALGTASVTFDGSDYRVSWQGTKEGARGVFSAQVSPVSGPGTEFTVSGIQQATTKHASSIAATGAGHFLVAYTQHDSATNWHRIKARLVEDVPGEEPCESGVPTLVITGSSEMTLECGAGTYSDLGAQAWDGCGNPLQVNTYNSGNDSSGPGPVLSAEGTYEVQYVAVDALGQTVSTVRTVHVEDRTAPTLELIGPTFMTHTCGSLWEDPGVESTDACYGNVAETVRTTGWVNGWAEGVYTLRYDVTDSGGNSAASVTRTVEVVDCPW